MHTFLSDCRRDSCGNLGTGVVAVILARVSQTRWDDIVTGGSERCSGEGRFSEHLSLKHVSCAMNCACFGGWLAQFSLFLFCLAWLCLSLSLPSPRRHRRPGTSRTCAWLGWRTSGDSSALLRGQISEPGPSMLVLLQELRQASGMVDLKKRERAHASEATCWGVNPELL